jgi:uncharacterized cupin superfamily protein
MIKHPPIINLDEIELETQKHGDAFEAKLGPIANHLGARKLGYRLVVLPPGKKAWPYHCHHANEEMFLVLEGTGILRYAGAEYSICQGDVICALPGSDTSHQIINTSDSNLRYLAVSTMEEPDVMEYPDSGKVVVFAGSAPGGDRSRRTFSFIAKQGAAVDYWEDES